ncbi:hypothetical protein RFH54_12105 [Acinetobacter soli]|uniref:hypothetical protein n=1 Tax=Acinetobacter soli TaxID=487316 RepID=UPI00280EC05D|nr:hypothetical protein [Acinetobacter soli]MDQ8996679.1 hypothetical protein [Acinetobacter soli]
MHQINIVLITLVFSVSSYCYADTIKVSPIGVIDSTDLQISKNIASNFFAARDTYGMRSNAVVAAFQANSEKPFDFPVLGFADLSDMANYQDRDSVTLYADNTAPSLKSWEIISNTKFTENSVISNQLNKMKIKQGMILDTDEKEKWSSYVIKVESDRIVTAGWVNSKTKKIGTPKDGTRVLINPVTKIWTTNFNSFIPKESLATSAAIQENGLINAKVELPNAINGIDTIVLPQSKYGGTAAYLARNAEGGYKQRWRVGFISLGSEINFRSSDSTVTSPQIGFLEDSSAENGLVFTGKNKKNSILWKNNNRIMAEIDSNGLISKIGYKTIKIDTDTNLSDEVGRYIIDSNHNITLKLPSIEKIFKGYTIKVSKVTPLGNVTFETLESKTKINNSRKLTINNKEWNKEAFFDGENWYIY